MSQFLFPLLPSLSSWPASTQDRRQHLWGRPEGCGELCMGSDPLKFFIPQMNFMSGPEAEFSQQFSSNLICLGFQDIQDARLPVLCRGTWLHSAYLLRAAMTGFQRAGEAERPRWRSRYHLEKCHPEPLKSILNMSTGKESRCLGAMEAKGSWKVWKLGGERGKYMSAISHPG